MLGVLSKSLITQRSLLRLYSLPVLHLPLRSFSNDPVLDEADLMTSYINLRKTLLNQTKPTNTERPAFTSDDDNDSNMYEEQKESTPVVVKKCTGCGSRLQSTDKNAIGFVFPHQLEKGIEEKDKQIICQRCRLLKYHNKVQSDAQSNIDILRKINPENLIDKIFLRIPKRSIVVNIIVSIKLSFIGYYRF